MSPHIVKFPLLPMQYFSQPQTLHIFPTMDEATSDLPSSAPAAPTVRGGDKSKKRGREERKKACYSWQKDGACKYGDACKYSHVSLGSAGAGTDGGASGGAPVVAAPPPPPGSFVPLRMSVQSALDRYYTRYFAVDVRGNPGFDQYVYAHSNCTCVLGITRWHALVTRGSPVVGLRFTLGKDAVEDVKVSGKLKHGSVTVGQASAILEATTADGTVYPVYCCIAGGIMELNQRLVTHPDLLRTHPETTGYVAITTPMKKDRMEALGQTMMTRSAYEALRGGEAPAPAPAPLDPLCAPSAAGVPLVAHEAAGAGCGGV